MNLFLKAYKCTLFVLILMLVVLLMPLSGESTGEGGMVSQIMTAVPFSDKLVHTGMFAFVTLVNYVENRKQKKLYGILWVLGLCGFAYLTEVLQKLSGYRTFDLYDILADVTGIVLGLALANWVSRSLNKRRGE